MVNVPVQNVKRENLAIATVIVNAVRKNAVALNKIELLKNHQLLSRGGVFCLWGSVKILIRAYLTTLYLI